MQLRVKGWMAGLALLVAATAPTVSAQDSEITAPCRGLGSTAPTAAREWCMQAAQAAASAQPQLGILIAAGNPLLGAGRAGSGFRLGILPQASITAKVNVVRLRLPELRASRTTQGAASAPFELVAPAISGTAMIGLFPGVNLAPALGGLGSVDLLAEAIYVPFRTLDTPDFAYGVGARIGIFRESFLFPGLSMSGMYRRLGDVAFGDVCQGTAQANSSDAGEGYTLQQGLCVTPGAEGDPGEFTFDLSNTSIRVVAAKRLLPMGIAAGIGYDRWASDLAVGFRAPGEPRFFRASGLDFSSGRFSAFANGVMTLPFLSFALEAGWLQGGKGLAGFDTASSRFDPTSGTWFGSVGVRVSL